MSGPPSPASRVNAYLDARDEFDRRWDSTAPVIAWVAGDNYAEHQLTVADLRAVLAELNRLTALDTYYRGAAGTGPVATGTYAPLFRT